MAESDDDNRYRPEDLRQWLRDEVRMVMKAHQLQITDATDFVTDFATGKITEHEVAERMSRYSRRWGESPLIVAMPDENTPDEKILSNLDAEFEARIKRWTERYKDKPTPQRHP